MVNKRIIEVAPSFPGEVFINRHVNSLHKKNFPVEILTFRPRKIGQSVASIQSTIDFKVNTLEFPSIGKFSIFDFLTTIKILMKFRNFPYKKSTFRDLIYFDYIKRLKPDLIHFHFGTLAGMLYWIPQKLGIPYTVSLRGSDIQVRPFNSNLKYDQIKQGINNASGIHTVCENLWITANPFLTKEVYHKTIYTTVPITEKIEFNKSSIDDEIKIVSIGRFHWRKNFIDLLKAISKLANSGVKTKLILIGDGLEKEAIVYWISALNLKENVTLTGILDNETINNILIDADCYIQSSIAEGFSNATAEAMALGLPVFATNVGGTNEIIKDGVNGFILDPTDSENWHKKLFYLRDQKKINMIRKAARETAKNVFSAETHACSFIDFYQHILNK